MRSKEERSDILEDIDPKRKGSCLVVGIDKRGNITKFNEEFEEMTGKKRAGVLNTPFSTFFSKEYKFIDSWMDLIIKMRSNEKIPDMDLPMQTKNGEDVLVSWTSFPLTSNDKNAVSMLNLVGTPISNHADSAANKTSTKNK
ncbi:MAG: hypothetical protein DRN27_05030, partial [Thermoplasmata archaeon]